MMVNEALSTAIVCITIGVFERGGLSGLQGAKMRTPEAITIAAIA